MHIWDAKGKKEHSLTFGGRGNRFTVSGSGARVRQSIFAEREGRRDHILYLHPWKLHAAQARIKGLSAAEGELYFYIGCFK